LDFFLEHVIHRLTDYLKQGKEDINNMEYRKSVRLTQAGAIPIEEQNAKKSCC
jgi:hypothetical protein